MVFWRISSTKRENKKNRKISQRLMLCCRRQWRKSFRSCVLFFPSIVTFFLERTGPKFKLLLCLGAGLLTFGPAYAQKIEIIKMDYSRANYLAKNLGNQAVMTQSGHQSLASLYKFQTPDIEALFAASVIAKETAALDLLFGGSSGAHAPKVYIQSSVKLGASGFIQTSQLSVLKFWAITTIGGHLIEKPCQADYGLFGVHAVKCNLADSPMPPSQTLAYLANIKPYNAHQINLSWTYHFD